MCSKRRKPKKASFPAQSHPQKPRGHKGTTLLSTSTWTAQSAAVYGIHSQIHPSAWASWPKRRCLEEGRGYQKAQDDSKPFLNKAKSVIEPLFRKEYLWWLLALSGSSMRSWLCWRLKLWPVSRELKKKKDEYLSTHQLFLCFLWFK